METWKNIEGYENKYLISSEGRVLSLVDNKGKAREKVLCSRVGNTGYLYVNLYKNSKSKTYKIHRLVAKCFIECDETANMVVNHKNCNKLDNRVDNLEWVTHKENIIHAHKNGRCRNQNGTKNSMYGKFGENNPTSKTVYQKDLEGTLIKIWGSVVDVERETGMCRHSISRCARGVTKSYNGFRWCYKK